MRHPATLVKRMPHILAACVQARLLFNSLRRMQVTELCPTGFCLYTLEVLGLDCGIQTSADRSLLEFFWLFQQVASI